MHIQAFDPMTDSMLDKGANWPGPLVPYQCGLPLFRWSVLGLGEAPPQSPDAVSEKLSPGLTPSCSATPALSSST
jgi:hypothetical protein